MKFFELPIGTYFWDVSGNHLYQKLNQDHVKLWANGKHRIANFDIEIDIKDKQIDAQRNLIYTFATNLLHICTNTRLSKEEVYYCLNNMCQTVLNDHSKLSTKGK